MLKFITKIIIVMLICFGIGKVFYQVECYSLNNCRVIDKNDGIVTIVDTRGHSWEHYMMDTNEGFELYKSLNEGDKVKVKWFPNHTDSYIEDDIIVRIAK